MNSEKRIFEVKVSELETLDQCATDERALIKTVRGSMDAIGYEEALLAAADTYPDASQVLPLLKQGQPGYIYAQAHKRLIDVLKRPSSASSAPDVIAKAGGGQPQQPL